MSAIERAADETVIELSLWDALDLSENPNQRYHIRQALQYAVCDREGGHD